MVSLRLLGAVALYLLLVAASWTFTIDDAYISMRYARNLIDGCGLAYNCGDLPLEGYTNFSLVVIEAALMRIGIEGVFVPKLVNAIAGAAFIAALSRRGAYGWAAALLLATSTPVILWTVGGLETVLFAALAVGGVMAALDGRLWLAQGLLVASALTRPEGALFWFVVSVWDYRSWRVALVGGLALVVYHGWRVSYFDALLPATYLAKETAFNGWTALGGVSRLSAFAMSNLNAFPLVLVTLRWRWNRNTALIAALAGLYAIYVVSRGYSVAMDDAYRLYVPLIALLCLWMAEVWQDA